MKLTIEEIIKRINDKLDSRIPFKSGFINGEIIKAPSTKDLRFELSNNEPKNIEENLDWFIITKEQAAEVITNYTGNDIEKELYHLNQFIIDNNISENMPMYLVAYLPVS